MVSPTKKSEHAAKTASHHTVKVVGRHRLGEGTHNTVFPEHIPGGGAFHSGSRNGHLGSHTVTSKGRK